MSATTDRTTYVVEVSDGRGGVTREEYRTEAEARERCDRARAAGLYAGWYTEPTRATD